MTTRLPPALPAVQVAAATAAAMAAPRSSPGTHTWVWLLTVPAKAGMSELSSGSAGWCQVAMSPAGQPGEVMTQLWRSRRFDCEVCGAEWAEHA